MSSIKNHAKTAGIHTALLLTILITAVPFYWAAQTSIKFTRDTISKTPTLWGFDVTADPYRKFWFDNDEQNMWHIGLFFLVLAASLAVLVAVKKRIETTWPVTLAICLSLWVALTLFPKFFEMNREFTK